MEQLIDAHTHKKPDIEAAWRRQQVKEKKDNDPYFSSSSPLVDALPFSKNFSILIYLLVIIFCFGRNVRCAIVVVVDGCQRAHHQPNTAESILYV